MNAHCRNGWTAAAILRASRAFLAAFVALFFLQHQVSVRAQAFPSKPVRIVVGFAAGGQGDTLARILAPHLSAQLKQPVIVENRPGASGIMATKLVTGAAPDGHTLLLVATTLVVNPSLYKNAGYDPEKDLAPIGLMATYPLYVVANPTAPRTIEELIAAARAKPGHFNFASGGIGAATHIAPELLAHMTKVKFTHVPYRGGGQSALAVASGEAQFQFAGGTVLPLVKSGKLNLIAVSSPKRLAAFPNVPTVAEAVPGFDASSWTGLFAPAGTPPTIIQRLNVELGKVLKMPETIEALKRLDAEPATSTPEEFGQQVKTEYVRWTRLIKELGITTE